MEGKPQDGGGGNKAGGGRSKRRRRRGGGAGGGPQAPEVNGNVAPRSEGQGPRGKDPARGGGPAAKNGNRAPGGGRNQPQRQAPKRSEAPEAKPKKLDPPEVQVKHVPRRYSVVFYETFAAARADLAALSQQASAVDQLNIVVRADGNMEDPELTSLAHVKLFAGAAWTLIHERRKTDGWYDEPR